MIPIQVEQDPVHKILEEQIRKYGLNVESSGNPNWSAFFEEVSAYYNKVDRSDSQEMVEAVLNAIPGYVSWLSADLHYIGVNQKLAWAFNLDRADFVGKPLNFLGAAGPFLPFAEEFISSSLSQDVRVLEMSFGMEDQENWYLVAGQKYGNSEQTVLVGIDITDIKKAEATIVQQQEQLAASAKLVALGQMAAAIAHEINGPLAVLMGNNDVLRRAVVQPEPDRDKLKAGIARIESNVKRIVNIVKGCRTFSRDGSSDPVELVALKMIIDDTLELCRGKFMEEKVTLKVGNLPDDLQINCRPTQLSQVLLNLLKNALDAVAGSKERWVSLETEKTEQAVVIRVIDSGSGITPETAEKLFTPFFTTKEPGKGTGLGLSICKGIINEHGGELSIDYSSKNTCFMIRLPL